MKLLAFLILLFLVLVFNGVVASANQLLGGWKLNHCNYDNEVDRVSFQIFLPLRNKHLLGNASSYDSTDNIINQNEIHHRLARAWSIFFPTEDEFQKVESFLFDVKQIPRNLCVRKTKDSIRCSSVAPKLVESLFENKINLCYYNHPRKASGKKNYLLTEITPIFTAGGYFSGKKTTFADDQHSAFVSGLSLHSFPTHFGKRRQEKPRRKVSVNSTTSLPPHIHQRSAQQQQQSFGVNVFDIPVGTSPDPVIIRVEELEYLGPSGAVTAVGLASVAIVFNCFDGSAGSYNADTTALSPISCPCGSTNVPTSVLITVRDDNGGIVQQPLYYITNDNPKLACSTVGVQYGQPVSTSVRNAVACVFDTQGDVTNLVTYQRYVISATVTFGSLGTSNDAPFRNYYAGQFQSYPSSSPPAGVTHSQVTPIISLASYPTDIQKMYGIDAGESVSLTSPTVSQGVFEFAQLGETNPSGGYNAADIVTYMRQIDNVNFKNLPIHYIGASTFAFLDAGESALDIELIMALGMNAPTVFWSVSIGQADADFTSFLEACTNLFSALATNATSSDFPRDIPFPTSWSISYGLSEQDAVQESSDMVTRSDHYLQILSNVGVHMYISSGDSGATENDGSNAMAHFPADLPHAVAVGASAFYRSPGSSAITEVACSALDSNVITSGGAISSFFSQPSYQSPYVEQNYRGIPDVSALGANIFAIVNGNTDQMYGTSAAAPIFAGIMTLVNNRLVLQGKGPLTNAHNFFYSSLNSSEIQSDYLFFDITSGNNCGTRANNGLSSANFPTLWIGNCYFASTGWDAVTGVGTPRFNNIVRQLTGESVAPNTFAPGAEGGSGSEAGGSGSGNGNSAAGQDASNILSYIENHWEYFAIGGGVLVFLLLVCCAILKKRSLDAQRREEVLLGGGNAALSGANNNDGSRSGRRSARNLQYSEYGGYGSVQGNTGNNNDANESLSSRNRSGVRYTNI